VNRIWKLEIVIVIMVHELMKKGVDESPDVTRDLKMPVVPEVDVFVAI